MDENDKINKQYTNGLGKIMEELYTSAVENLCTFPDEELYPFPESENKMKSLIYDKEP